MKNKQNIIKRKWYPAVTGLLAISTLGTTLALIRSMADGFSGDTAPEGGVPDIQFAMIRTVGIALFVLLAVLHLIRFLYSVRQSRLLSLKHLIYTILSAYAALLLVRNGESASEWALACLLYMSAALIDCILTLIQKKNKWYILLIIVMILVVLIGVLAVFAIQEDDLVVQRSGSFLSVFLLFILVDVQGVASIVPIAFSSIRMDILKKIIRKTYAAEILFGIILLIVAFSFILPAFEENISTFGDALWYCFAIVTTIGFGDITATSVVGRILSVILGVYGIIVVSLITSIIVNFYGEMKKEEAEEDGEDSNHDGSVRNRTGNDDERRIDTDTSVRKTRKDRGRRNEKDTVYFEEIDL